MVQTFIKRPVSPLYFEPISIPSKDVLWPGSDDEADEGERERKRVRIEELGKQYLDGRTLFIQTAGLRGPFDQGWVNPWAREKRKIREVNHGSNVIPKGVEAAIYDHAEGESTKSRAQRRSIIDARAVSLADRQASEVRLEDFGMKRRRLDEATGPMRQHAQGYPRTSDTGAGAKSPEARIPFAATEEIYRAPWLKTDPRFLQLHSTDDGPSSTPTPVTRPKSKPREDPGPRQKSPITAIESPEAQDAEIRQSIDVQLMKSKHLHTRTESCDKGVPGLQITRNLLKPAPISDDHDVSHQNPRTRVRTINLSKADSYTKHAYAAVKRLSQEAVTTTSSRIPQEAVIGASEGTGKPTPSRLAPYVSELDHNDVSATSAGLKAVKKAPAPKPSPHAAPMSASSPEFRYRYSSKEMQLNASKSIRSFVQPSEGPPLRRRSASSSSTDSSKFAKEFEAAQAKAGSKSLGSSYSSSPVKERHETTSVKKNTQALRRLTFTASGEPRIAESRKPLKTNSRSSVAIPSSLSPKSNVANHKISGTKGPVGKDSKKSSDVPLTNGNVSHNSAVLAEAQVVSDAPVQLARLPSGTSTNLLETDKQSPKFISLDDEDSYLDLSTQAAMQKAQRSFKEDIISPVKFKVPTSPHKSPKKSRFSKTDITPTANGRPSRAAESKFVKAEPEDDEEPMSTQAMADAISPFAITTIKKRPPASQKEAGFAASPTRERSPRAAGTASPDPSPTHSFHKPLSMSTTPSTSQKPPSPPKPTPPIPLSRPNTTSKPPSTLTSFSILRNGTMTESSSILQDGQQSPHDVDISLPLDPLGTPFGTATANGNGDMSTGNWDLGAALEDAGSFLGDWNVEAEARKEGNERRKRAGWG